MRLFLARIGSASVDQRAAEFERLAEEDGFRKHELAADPENADVVLFTQCHMVDWRLRAIRDHPLAQRFRDRVMVYDDRDRPWRSFPGVYASMPAGSFDATIQRAWGYVLETDGPTPIQPDLLFSFVGSSTARCREPLYALSHPDGVVERSEGFALWDNRAAGFANWRASYLSTLHRSRFVLCPRGRGTSTFRLYETLAAGRVPIIISDDWVAPTGPDWHSFAIRWPEGVTTGLLETMQEHESRWDGMSVAARDAFDSFFSRRVAFHRIADLLDGLRANGATAGSRLKLSSAAIRSAVRERSRSIK
jgi:Exostosin family